jgi:hypothetical protein
VEVEEGEWDKADLCNHLAVLVEAQMEARHLAQAEAVRPQI